MAKSSASLLPAGYGKFLEDIKQRVRAAQVRATLSANRELITLYWDIGKGIIERQRAEGWGKAVVERLAKDLQKEFPGITGFSPLNVWRMRAFYLAWTADLKNLSQPVTDSEIEELSHLVTEIPWGHNIVLIHKVRDPVTRVWYARKTLEYGWSRVNPT
jgi:predicted nuclease of restriction endonuclease-like (RecB) superfamily